MAYKTVNPFLKSKVDPYFVGHAKYQLSLENVVLNVRSEHPPLEKKLLMELTSLPSRVNLEELYHTDRQDYFMTQSQLAAVRKC